MIKRRIFTVTAAVIALLSCCILIACGGKKGIAADKSLTVTLLSGEHYSVVGENKRAVSSGESVTFTVSLERGYKIVGAYGDECEISDEKAFEQTVKITDVQYKSTVRLETAEMEITQFEVFGDEQAGVIEVSSALGQADDDAFYKDDKVTVSATVKDGYRFQCWSKGGYMNGGGEFYDYNDRLENVDFVTVGKLYANFKNLADTGNMIFYRMDCGEIEQDVTQLLEHHPRANTYTAVDMREFGVDCDSRHLAGWMTDGGEYIGLGSRVTVSDKTATVLTPVWKEYTDASLFEVNQGNIVSVKDALLDANEIVVPREINGTAVTTISENAFSGCAASTYYIPDSVTAIEDNAFSGCENLTDFYMSDNIMTISDKSFSGCKNFTTLHLNAYLRPRFRKHIYSNKLNVYDKLAVNKESSVQKIILLAGSSVKYGYSENVINSMLEGKEVYNLGNNREISGIAQAEIISRYLDSSDTFIFAPEIYCTCWSGFVGQSYLTNDEKIVIGRPQFIYIMFEGNWQFISDLVIYKYADFFDGFSSFNKTRIDMKEMSYFDYCPTVETGYGVRPNGEFVYGESGSDTAKQYITIDFESVKDYAIINAKNMIFDELDNFGVDCYLTFSTINKSNLLNHYGSEESVKQEADSYTERVKGIIGDSAKMLLTQYDTVYDGRHFYNSDYHLGDPYRNTHTEKVISALIAAMKSEGRL